jgi:hypothetical protein
MSRSAAKRARRDGVEAIEIVDADPAAFGGAPVAVVADEGGSSEPRSPRRQAPAWVVGLAVVLTIGAAGTVAWKLRPWYNDPVVIVRAAIVVPTLTNQLVIGTGAGTPTGALITNTVERPTPGTTESGAVFVDASATVGNPGTARAVFYRTDLDSSGDPTFDPSDTISSGVVHGGPAAVVSSGSGVTVRWQPSDGKIYVLRTDRLDPSAALRLANAITSDGPTVRISPRSALGQLRVVGTMADTDRMEALFVASQAFARGSSYSTYLADASAVAVRYRHAGMAVGTSIGPRTMELLESTFPLRSHVTVHGHNAIEFDITSSFDSGERTFTTVMWTEGGRLIAVTSTSPALAEQYAAAVRPATDAEWRQVVRLSSPVPTG